MNVFINNQFQSLIEYLYLIIDNNNLYIFHI